MTSSTEDADQEAVIAFLARPESYGISGQVERIDTHAAIVFLAGERAYKLKRAVRYPYLDFSTPGKRKAVCETELALNRRTAPELYLEVRSVNRAADGTLGFGAGEPVDWLIVMRRFEADDVLEAVAQRGGLDSAVVRELADEIARFHDYAEVVRSDGSDRVRNVIAGNSESMAEVTALRADMCHALHEQSMAEWQRLSPLLDRRAGDGHVRHCHGDLHLANICLWKGKPTLFDCLEFDTDLATTDVLYDLAFLLMDLWERGYRLPASQLLNRYLDMREESDGIAALPLFLSMRAAIRAHVGASAACRQSTEVARLEKLAQARDYLRAAEAFLIQPAARLIAIGGLSGTGKSTLAGLLAPAVGGAPGARWLRTDVLRKRLAGVDPETRLPPQAYTHEVGAAVYERLLDEAAEALAAGRSVIVDGVFADPAERAKVAAVASSTQVRFAGLWLTAPRELLIARIEGRRGDASDADRHVVERQLEYDVGELGAWHVVDAEGPAATVLDKARRLIA